MMVVIAFSSSSCDVCVEPWDDMGALCDAIEDRSAGACGVDGCVTVICARETEVDCVGVVRTVQAAASVLEDVAVEYEQDGEAPGRKLRMVMPVRASYLRMRHGMKWYGAKARASDAHSGEDGRERACVGRVGGAGARLLPRRGSRGRRGRPLRRDRAPVCREMQR